MQARWQEATSKIFLVVMQWGWCLLVFRWSWRYDKLTTSISHHYTSDYLIASSELSFDMTVCILPLHRPLWSLHPRGQLQTPPSQLGSGVSSSTRGSVGLSPSSSPSSLPGKPPPSCPLPPGNPPSPSPVIQYQNKYISYHILVAIEHLSSKQEVTSSFDEYIWARVRSSSVA